MPMPRKMTDEKIAEAKRRRRLVYIARRDHSIAAIAADLGVSTTTVSKAIYGMSYSRPKPRQFSTSAPAISRATQPRIDR